MSITADLITRIIDQTDLSYNYCWKIPTDKNIEEQRNFRHRIRYCDMLFQYKNFDLRNISFLRRMREKITIMMCFFRNIWHMQFSKMSIHQNLFLRKMLLWNQFWYDHDDGWRQFFTITRYILSQMNGIAALVLVVVITERKTKYA